MMKYFSLLLLLLFSTVSFCQVLTKKQIDSGFESGEIGGKKKEKLYILNGIPFDNSDSAKLDSALAVYSINHLVSIDILKCPNPNFSHCYKDVVLLLFATQQKTKTKRKIWHTVKQYIKETYPGNSPFFGKGIKYFSLTINNTSVHSSEIRKVLKSIKRRDIYHVAFSEVTDNVESKPAGAMLKIWKKH